MPREWMCLAIATVAYIILFLYFYPPMHGIEDEVGFINQTIALSRGALTAEGAGFANLPDFHVFDGRHVGIRNPGRPLLGMLFVRAAGAGSVFLPGLLIHVGLTGMAGLTLARHAASPLWAVLVLWHPTLALYSRTVLGDSGAGLGLLAAVSFAAGPSASGAAAGLAIALGAAMRYQAGLILPFFAGAIAVSDVARSPRREGIRCLLSGGAVGCVLIGYNLLLYGSPTGVVKGEFGVGYLPGNALYYSISLMILWPGMLLAPILDRSRIRHLSRAVCLPTLLFFLVYYFHDRGSGALQTLVLGQRLMQIALPVWIVSYALVLDRSMLPWVAARISRTAVGAIVMGGILSLTAANGLMFARHQRHLERFVLIRASILSQVPAGSLLVANSTAWKLVGVSGDAGPVYRLMDFNAAALAAASIEEGPWYLAVMEKNGAIAPPADELEAAIRAHRCRTFPSGHEELRLYRCGGRPQRPAPSG